MTHDTLKEKYEEALSVVIMTPKKMVPLNALLGTRLSELIDSPTKQYIATARDDIINAVETFLTNAEVKYVSIQAAGSVIDIDIKVLFTDYRQVVNFTYNVEKIDMALYVQYLKQLYDVIDTLDDTAADGDGFCYDGTLALWKNDKNTNSTDAGFDCVQRVKTEVNFVAKEQTSAPAPLTGYTKIFAKSDGLYCITGAGTTLQLNNKVDSALFSDTKANSAEGDSSTAATWNARTINTTKYNNIAGCTLAANVITLANAGTYKIKLNSTAHSTNRHKARLNYNAGSSYAIAMSGYAVQSNYETGISSVIDEITITASTTISVEHYTQSLHANGFGRAAADTTGTEENYLTVEITKIK